MQQTLTLDTTTVIIRTVDTAPLTSSGRTSLLHSQKATVEMIVRDVFGSKAQIGHYDDGAPYIIGREDMSISISHCKEFVAVAFDKTKAVGVDVESPRYSTLQKIIARVLRDDEQDYMQSPLLMLRAWTMKEALFKATRGLGLKTLGEIPIPTPNSRDVEICGGKFSVVTFENLGYTGCTLSIAMGEQRP